MANYGLVFDYKLDDAVEQLFTHVPYLTSREDLGVSAEGVSHELVIGDNAHALTALLPRYREAVDVIYIDPPYNTGNKDFIYNDSFVDKEDPWRHSKWLSFMKTRLRLAKLFLKDTGVIFVSIDDNEQAQLKMLLDETFGEENFVGCSVRKTKSTTNDARTGFNMQHEFLFIYAKDKQKVNLQGEKKDFSNYKNPDNDPQGPWISDNPSAKSGSKENNWFPIENPHTGKIDYPPLGNFWRFSKNTIQNHIDNGTLVFKKTHKPEERGFIWKRHQKKVRSQRHPFNSLEFIDNEYMNQAATKETLRIIGDSFTYPKGLNFLKKIIDTCPNQDAIIMDFFAGSGTTGHAVALLNAEDGGSRKTILVTNNENGIAENVTAKRMKRALTGREWADGKPHPNLEQGLIVSEVQLLEQGSLTERDLVYELACINAPEDDDYYIPDEETLANADHAIKAWTLAKRRIQ